MATAIAGESIMSSPQLDTLRWQFELTWKLANFHLPHLTDEGCLWEPAPGSWNVRKDVDGKWRPDWSESEPNPAPPVSIGWLTWHILWWWSGLLAAVRNEKPIVREEVFWPGNAAAVRNLFERLADEWTDFLSGLTDGDLGRQVAYPWSEPRPLSYALAWANSELMKNVAEIGYGRHLFEAARPK